MNFSEALVSLKEGKLVTREGWNGKGMHLGVQFPDEMSANKQPYIFIIPVGGERIPWVASHADLFAEDWSIVEMSQGTA